jgi:hypothetical protein
VRKKLLLAVATVAFLLGGIGFLASSTTGLSIRLHSKARKDWKNNATVEIAHRASDTNWLASEMEMLRKQVIRDRSDSSAWFSDHLILLTNGEWIVFASKCGKEDRRIHDIFIGRGSDGCWYYSTFHFCIGMLDLRMEEPSASLAEFRENYFLQEFDGRSDECLKKTWPPKRN